MAVALLGDGNNQSEAMTMMPIGAVIPEGMVQSTTVAQVLGPIAPLGAAAVLLAVTAIVVVAIVGDAPVRGAARRMLSAARAAGARGLGSVGIGRRRSRGIPPRHRDIGRLARRGAISIVGEGDPRGDPQVSP
jgi:hypothetical protein